MKLSEIKTIPKWLHKKGFFTLLSSNFLIQFLGFGTTLLVAKMLTAIQLGEIRIIQTYTSLFIVPAGFGFSTAVLKYCAEVRSDSDKASILRSSLIYSFFSSVFAYTILFIMIVSGVMTSSIELRGWLVSYTAIAIPLSVWTGIFIVYLQALKKINQMARTQIIIRLQSLVLILVLTWKFGFHGFIYATLIAFIIGFIPLMMNVGIKFLKAKRQKLPKGFISVAVYSVLGTSVTAIGQYIDIFMLDHFTNERAAIGYYSLALTFASAAMLVTSTVQVIITPYFSEHSGDKNWVYSNLKKYQIIMSALSIIVAVAVTATATIIIFTVFKQEYRISITYLTILAVRYVILSCYAVIGGAFVGLGIIRYGFILVCATTPIGIALSFIMLKYCGIQGVAWAQVVSSAINLIIVAVTYKKALEKHFNHFELSLSK